MTKSFLRPNLHTGALLLEDGEIFTGYSFGYEGPELHQGVAGEVIFNTAMSGYQEILTDPSYHGQNVVMTYPLIGNYGWNEADVESTKVWSTGFIVHEYSERDVNWRSKGTLRDYLIRNRIPALTGIDTRSITRHIRSRGAMNSLILSPAPKTEAERLVALEYLRSLPAFGARDLVAEVTCREAYEWTEPTDELHAQWRSRPLAQAKGAPLVAVLDMGCKLNSMRSFSARGCRVRVFPASASPEEILKAGAKGLFLSNGPGDPEKVAHAAETTKKLLGKLPIFGICMGHQILATAIGAKTFKMKFGHHGGNQPVLDIVSGRVMITSQNHGYAVDPASLPKNAKVTQLNLNDQSVEGIALPDQRAFSVQYHPEACPGPRDAELHFDQFVSMLG